MVRGLNIARRIGWIVALALAFPGVAPAQTQGSQSPAELRRENDALRERIDQLEAALDEARAQTEALTRQVESLRSELERARATPRPAAPMEPESGPVPLDRFACPEALLLWLSDDYTEAFGPDPSPAMQDIRQWIRRANLTRAEVRWHVRVLEVRPDDGAPDAVRVVNFIGATGETICAPYTLQLGPRDLGRLRAQPDVERWTIEGIFAAKPGLNPDRTEPETGVSPDLIGPHTEFGWSLTVRSMSPYTPPDLDDGGETPR